jgi:sn-glycerol 3-phosphate transport system permease protein
MSGATAPLLPLREKSSRAAARPDEGSAADTSRPTFPHAKASYFLKGRRSRARSVPRDAYAPTGLGMALESAGAILLAILWVLPLLFAVWAAFHATEHTTNFSPFAPVTLENFSRAWAAAPFARYFLNTFLLVTLILACQLVLGTLAGYAFARFQFIGREIAFALVLAQLMIMPDILIVENYRTMSRLGLIDTIPGIALPYIASAFGIFLLRQTFRTIPRELDEAARVEGANALQVLLKVYVPLAKPIYIAYGLVSVSYHWNNFLWPLIVTNSVEARPLTVGLQIFSSVDQGIDWSIVCAATLMTSAPLLIGFLLFQRAFVQSFMRAGIR